MVVPDANYQYNEPNLKPIPYESLDLTKDWNTFTISDPLTDKGLQKFSDDWNTLVA